MSDHRHLILPADAVHHPKNATTWFNGQNGRLQFGFTDDASVPLAPLGELAPDGVNFVFAPFANAGGPVKKDVNGWPIIPGYTKNP